MLGASRDTLLAVVRRHGSAQMLAGVPMVDDLRGLVVDRPLEVAPVFLGAIRKCYDLQSGPYSQHRRQLRIELGGQRLLLILWRSPVAHRVELLGVCVKERHGATPHFPGA